jgi:hypothetical protein
MGMRVTTVMIDDLDGAELHVDEARTVQFALEGKSYEIDLGPANTAGLREALAPYIAAGRRQPRRGRPRR